MKSIRNLLFSGALALSALTVVTYTSCTKDECKDVVCNNGGTCVDGNCQCQNGYEGTNCDVLSAVKFTGNWRTTTEACTVSGSNSQYDIAVSPSGTTGATLLISNLYDDSRTTTATFTSPTTFTITSQQFGAASTISGSGSITNDQLIISYTVAVGSATDQCNNVVFSKL